MRGQVAKPQGFHVVGRPVGDALAAFPPIKPVQWCKMEQSIVVSKARPGRLVASKPGRENPDFVYVYERSGETAQLPAPPVQPPRVSTGGRVLWGLAFLIRGVAWLRGY